MRPVLLVLLLAFMGSTALVIRNRNLLKRTIRQVPSTECTCVDFNQCRSNGTVNKFGVTLINIRRIGPCGHYLEVCCKPEDLILPSQQSTNISLSDPLPSSSPLPESSITDSPVSSSSSDDTPEPIPLATDRPALSLSPDSSPPSPSATDVPSPLPSSSLPESPDTPAPSTDGPPPSPSTDDSPSSPLPSDLLRNPTIDNISPNPSTDTPSFSPSSPLPADNSESSSSTDSPLSSSPPPSNPETDSPAPNQPVIDGASSPLPNIPSVTDIPFDSSADDPDSLQVPPRPISPDRYESPGCGIRNIDGVGFRIVGAKDHEAQFGEFPWVIALLKDDETFVCGASLIHPKVVMTSAHCVISGVPEDKLVARAGEWDRATTREVLPHQDRKIVEVIEHKDFYGPAVLNDIALLILQEPFKLTSIVDTICLPTQDEKFDFSQCVASGWGKENFNSNKDQVILKRVNLPIVPTDTCESILQTTRLGKEFELHDSFLCAGGKKNEDTCTGDGGSPLMCPSKTNPLRYEQAGIVAWGIGCGDVIPGVYANVARFRSWIDSQLNQRNITISDRYENVAFQERTSMV